MEYRRDDAQDKKEEAALLKKTLAATATASKKVIEVKAEVVEKKVETKAATGPKMNYNEMKEFNKLEKEIEKLGLQIDEYEQKLSVASSTGQGYSALADLTEKMNACVMQRELKEQRWMEMADGDE